MVSEILTHLSPYARLGKLYRIPHRNRHGVSMTRLLRRHWIIDTPINKRDHIVRFVVGECSLIQNVTEALNHGYIVEIVTGPKIRDAETREKLADLLRDNGPERLRVYAAQTRPNRHSALINGNILYEDIHMAQDDYSTATAIEGADECTKNLLINHFNNLKNNSTFERTPELILSMQTLN